MRYRGWVDPSNDSEVVLKRCRAHVDTGWMLRPACRHTIDELLVAAQGSDRDLDLALLRVGVLAPADLDQIKSVLTLDGVSLRATVNPDGHCLIEVWRAGEPLGCLLHNGDVDLFDAVVAVVAA